MIRVLRMNKLVKQGESNLLAFVDVEINDLKISGMKVLEGKDGMYIGYPREKGKDEKYYNIILPVTEKLEKEISKAILDYYNAN